MVLESSLEQIVAPESGSVFGFSTFIVLVFQPGELGRYVTKDASMGFMSNHFLIEHEGHTIEVEAAGSFSGKTIYSLILDNERVDRTEATFGACTLLGKLTSDDSESPKPFVIRIKTRIFSENCTLEIDGNSFKLSSK